MSLVALMAPIGCASDDDGGGGGGADARMFDGRADSSMGTPDGSADSAPIADARPPDASAIDATPSPVVFNEVKGEDPDWMELYNTDAGTIDLSGYTVADSVGGTTDPDLGDAFTFPSGTTIAAGGYLFLLDDETVPAGPSTSCAPSPASSCFTTTFGVSEATGESLHLLNPAGQRVGTFAYPAGVPSGSTYGRQPDGSTTLVNMSPTPGVANASI